jgi:hypothetical protein
MEKTFRGWPAEAPELQTEPVFSAERQGIRFEAVDFTSQQAIRLRLYLIRPADADRPATAELNVLDAEGWFDFLATMRPAFAEQLDAESLPSADEAAWQALADRLRRTNDWVAYVAPRGIGPTAWDQSKKKQTQHRRRFYLLGQTLDGMRIWDVRRAVDALRSFPGAGDTPLRLQARRRPAGLALYAALFEPDVQQLDLVDLSASHRNGPYLLNVRRFMDIPQAVTMAAERCQVTIHAEDADDVWAFPAGVAKQLDWPEEQLQMRRE